MTENTPLHPVVSRVALLRQWMEEKGLAAFILPTADPHNSEFLPAHWMAREWITGFTGSAGLAVITANQAALWTDSRYFLQAEEQLAGTPFTLMREGQPDVPDFLEWMKDLLPQGATIGCCGEMFPAYLGEGMTHYFQLVDTGDDFFDRHWTDRPALSTAPVTRYPMTSAGMKASEKLAVLRHEIQTTYGQQQIFLNDLSDIAWLLNLRGTDVDYNPFFLAYLLIEPERTTLFIQPEKLTEDIQNYLSEMGVHTADYTAWGEMLRELPHNELLLLPEGISQQVQGFLQLSGIPTQVISSPVEIMRAIKNPTEQESFRRAMEEDGATMVCFLHWLDDHIQTGEVTEVSLDHQLTAFRAARKGFRSLSFPTIAGYGPHGAIVHYEATPETDIPLQPKGLLLLDSGAHYDYGTTDLTRTIALGELTPEERKVYTLVLKGHIALNRCIFPEGTTGLALDMAARYPMWQAGYDFGHGTGHGVGACLGVHEGPHQIRKNLRACTQIPFQQGMTVTNEPGIYVPGKFGVRIENVLLVRKAMRNDFGSFLQFEQLTLCPYDLRAVDFSLLNADEIQWINDYHAEVRKRLLPLLSDAADQTWLIQATTAIEVG
ncbi:peptidase, M24 family protein [gut metagenome]|uniref:Peptidase, M24 family protein n=1 Tax=gut metagenome TaxID=749906 RepID=J9GH27_9ZZZZ